MVRRTKEEAQATREHILDTAELVFQRQGVSMTSLNDIALAAGVTRGAIYWHFRDKSDLFEAMTQRVCLPLEETRERTRGGGDPIGQLRGWCIEALQRCVDDPQVRRVIEIAKHKVEYIGEIKSGYDRHRRTRETYVAHVRSELQRARLQHRFAPGRSVQAAAIGMHALIDGLLHNWLFDPEAFDLVRTGTEVLDAYLAGLAIAKEAPQGTARARPTPRTAVVPAKARPVARRRAASAQ